MRTVHLIYPHGSQISNPNAIGRQLGSRLGKKYRVIYHEINEAGVIRPAEDDVLIGHSWPTLSLFSRSCAQPGWKRVILMQPYCHGDYLADLDAFVERFIRHCDLFLAITDSYWFKDIPNSQFKHWFPKMRQLDLAVDRKDFPALKMYFNPPGKRRFVYIGDGKKCKNTEYLSQVAQSLPEMEFGWIGTNSRLTGVRTFGHMDFGTQAAKDQVSQYDFLIHVSKADGNPTTVLEAMSWGLIPVCTPESGYESLPGILNVPLNRLNEAAARLRDLQYYPKNDLRDLQQLNWKAIEDHFNWDRFTRDVIDAIESAESPDCLSISLMNRLSLLCTSYRDLRLGAWHFPRSLARKLLNKFQENTRSKKIT